MKKLHLLLLTLLLLTISCGEQERVAHQNTHADSLIDQAYRTQNYDSLLALTERLEAAGSISMPKANYWLGYACYRLRQARRAEFYWKKVVDANVHTDIDYYARSASHLTSLLLLKSDYEGTLNVAMPAVKKLEETGCDTLGDYASLFTSIGCCQLYLGRTNEAEASNQRAYEYYQRLTERNPTIDNLKSALISMINITTTCLNSHHFDEAMGWTERFELLLNRCEKQPDISAAFVDKQRARLYFYRATALQGLDKPREAAESYKSALATQYAQTDDGRIEACEYLLMAKRWAEAADNFRNLDHQFKKYDMQLSLDNIQKYMLPKYRANMGAGRRDSVIATGLWICDALDSAVVWQRQDDAAELATVYETQQKEARITQQQVELSKQRWVSTLIALALITSFFVVYIYVKRKAAKRLETAHTKLQTAYDQLEKTTAAKERYESELRIAREIQDSIVPSVFPEHKDFDLYASMTPAKAVGGDLYDFSLDGKHLYFCLGDVSGKGIPASLFMAQAARLFRALAKQHRMPADIATRLNDELIEGNERGMFVTMFLGMVDIETGHLYFCNAGHNPPIISCPSGELTADGSIIYKPRFMEMETNAAIGLWPDLQFVGEEIDDIKGELLFVYTDGLNEAENLMQEQLGEDRLLDMLRNTHYETCQQAIETFLAVVEGHRNGAEPNDDLTMLCLYVRP